MRSPLVPLLVAAVAAVLVASAVLVWALPGGGSDAGPPHEVVVGESPGAEPVEQGDEGIVAPPPPVTDHDGDGTPDAEDPDHPGTEPPRESPSATPSGEPDPTPSAVCGDDDDDDCDDDDWGDDDDD
ncbi:hypothetical protein Q8791_21765 [Nocardiopsis sp. CT-R113]|uniref:Uncharacterized protein n=1 Tax=Nocardiopsis codii TaxID=3065942 RepID=A0ABU7KC88_9ACTN|nr:hypothetical protein [Nocardiopsis sp. CT-R113]MEE2039846.1 hypothetical protein [Nocardiopsis sp. CT-R113]